MNEEFTEFDELLEDYKKKDNVFVRIFKAIFPCKGDSKKEIVRKILLFVAIIVMIVSGCYLLSEYVVKPYFISKSINSQNELLQNGESYNSWNDVKSKYDDVNFPTGMQMKYADLYAKNNDFAGWLRVEAAGVDMAVVKSKNNEEYLNTGFDGGYAFNGCLFMDYRNDILNPDSNTVIYGHHIQTGEMFGRLKVYRELDTFKNFPIIKYSTLFNDYNWKVCAVFITNAESKADNGFVFNYNETNIAPADMERFAKEIKQRSVYETGVDIKPDDKLLTLSTCIYDFKNARLVVVARMVRKGESLNVDTSKAHYNDSPKYPQAWYDANKMTNPYKNSVHWNP